MKITIPSLLAGAMMIVASATFADCPLNMAEEKLVECLTVEGSGENYQDYQKKFQEELADMAEETANNLKALKEEESRLTAIVH